MHQFVIVIDDSLVIRKILETCLQRAGYEVRSFADGVEALRWLATPEARIPALILVDLGLPKLDGYEVIRHLKARPAFEQTVFVIVSRRDGVLDRLKGRLAGAHAYLTKPFQTGEVLAVVQAHLGAFVSESDDERATTADQREDASRQQEGSTTQSTTITEHCHGTHLAYEAATHGLTGLAYGTTMHDCINSCMEQVAVYQEQWASCVGEAEATCFISDHSVNHVGS